MDETEEWPVYSHLRINLNENVAKPIGLRNQREFDVLQAVKDGRVAENVSNDELMLTLASEGHSIETTADALGLTLEEVEMLAIHKDAELATHAQAEAHSPTHTLPEETE